MSVVWVKALQLSGQSYIDGLVLCDYGILW